jgi:small subunit ribosomal protein S14
MKHKHVQRDLIKRELIKKTESRRLALKALRSSTAMRYPEAKFGHSINYRNRCVLTGRPRGVYNCEAFFKISRLMIREFASKGLLPGLKKASW